jgi:hypothetical protein
MKPFNLVAMALWPSLLRAFAPTQRRAFLSTALFAEDQKKIPMTLLSGFLGSGKVGLFSLSFSILDLYLDFQI